MKKLLLIAVILAGINNKLCWTPADNLADGFNTYCNTSSGAYTKVKTVDAKTTCEPLKDMLNEGNWYCNVTAFNSNGESPPSNDVNFRLDLTPSATPKNLRWINP